MSKKKPSKRKTASGDKSREEASAQSEEVSVHDHEHDTQDGVKRMHPHEPPVLITDGSLEIETDEPLLAAGSGSHPSRPHKRRHSNTGGGNHIRCVIIERNGVEVFRDVFVPRTCRIKIFFDTHSCDPPH